MLLPFLYAETHYRFKYFFSYLRKREPEIIVDIPLRIKAGDPLPILIIVKDADKYPLRLLKIEVKESDISPRMIDIDEFLDQVYQDRIISIDTSGFSPGKHLFEIKVYYNIRGRERFCLADNHRSTSHAPFSVYLSAEDLPRLEDCLYGEVHCHTNYTSDQVEFGASLSATKNLARAMGLNFFCATDHSYDMDDFKDNYLKNDPDLGKWNEFLQSVAKLNQVEDSPLIIPGEEVTIRNSRNKNVHLLVYNSKKFFPGSGDSAEKWFRTQSEFTLDEIAGQLEDHVLLFAAHPTERPPFLQQLFIRRGIWDENDCQPARLDGLQFINGGENIHNQLGKELWIKQLLAGRRLIGLAGNDAHGNFSRFRQIGFPFFTMRENHHHIFGKWRTGVYAGRQTVNVPSVLQSIKAGHCFMTNGPALQIQAGSGQRWVPMGAACHAPEQINISARSTAEYGTLKKIRIYTGDTKTRSETIIFSETFDTSLWDYTRLISISSDRPRAGYIRAEVNTQGEFEAISNPIWVE